MSESFTEKLRMIQRERESILCVGIDPDPKKIPEHLRRGKSIVDAVITFNRTIIQSTEPFACAFKFNLAFFEILGRDGWRALEESLHSISPDTIVIADGKRGDIGNSARFYAASVFEQLRFHACTVSPYMGHDAIQPFLDYEGKAAFILAKTSNPGSSDFQDWGIPEQKLFERVLRVSEKLAETSRGELGFVVGATDPGTLLSIRREYPNTALLIPGIGAQGGSPDEVLKAVTLGDGPILVNSSRQILFASGEIDYADMAAKAAESMKNSLTV